MGRIRNGYTISLRKSDGMRRTRPKTRDRIALQLMLNKQCVRVCRGHGNEPSVPANVNIFRARREKIGFFSFGVSIRQFVLVAIFTTEFPLVSPIERFDSVLGNVLVCPTFTATAVRLAILLQVNPIRSFMHFYTPMHRNTKAARYAFTFVTEISPISLYWRVTTVRRCTIPASSRRMRDY
jgi:hypothetical protein